VALLLGYVFRALSVDSLVNGYQSEHINHARLISNELWDSHFESLVQSANDLSAEQLAKAAEIPALHQHVSKLLEGTKIFKIKVYNLKGRTAYSTELNEIGEEKINNAGVIAGLRGQNSSELVHHDQLSTFEGKLQDRDLVESYIPRFDPQTGQVSGVFEIYRDATSVLVEVRQRQTLLVGAVIALLAVLYLFVVAVVRQAQKRLIVQSHERQKALQALALSEERWKFALEGSGDGVWDRNLQTGEVVFSRRYKEIYGFSDDELEDHAEAWEERVHPDDLASVIAERNAYLKGDKSSYVNVRRMQCKDGSWKWILSRGMVVAHDTEGKPLRMIGTHNDVTAQHEHEQALQLAATVMQTMDEAVMVTDADNTIISVNPAFTRISGYAPEDAIGRKPGMLASGIHPPSFYQTIWQRIADAGSWKGEICNRHKNGAIFMEWLSIHTVCNRKGVISNYVAVFSDITERKTSEAHMQQLAHFDALTELPNRALFNDRLRQGVARAQRDKNCLALMFIDLDKFKPVNDKLGHAMGDVLLKAAAKRLLQCVRRESDTVARIGGDEFVVLLAIDNPQDAMLVAANIQTALEQPFQLKAHVVSISASIGVAIFPEHGSDEKTLMNNADTAMYQSKEGGRNQVQLFQQHLSQ
jgi:diguanylate cyclase (GGDEF)-like protein/PAS domain S-box-containing protein